MIIFPAIDIIGGEAVRLYRGDYNQKTVYGTPYDISLEFKAKGATHVHIVDLDGAKSGGTPNIETIKRIAADCKMFVEVGGGIRSLGVIEKYVRAGVSRVILGTAAVKDPQLIKLAVREFGGSVAVGADMLDGKIRINGWLEAADISADDFFGRMQDEGIQNVICTDISKDGAMKGTNLELYRELSQRYNMSITASGGVSSLEDIKALKSMGMYGAIVGKAYYTGAVDLEKAIEVAR